MTNESNLWLQLKRNLPSNTIATRIENRTGGGIPDVHLLWSGLPFWMELKTTKNKRVNLSPQQIAWNTAYSRSGGLSFILVKHLSSGALFLFRGSKASEVGRSGLDTEAEFRGLGYEDLWAAVRDFGGRDSYL